MPFRILLLMLCILLGTGESGLPRPQSREVIVYAAASLSGAFQEIANELAAESQGLHIAFNFAGSQEIVRQLEQGAPADVIALASMDHMRAAVRTGRVDSSTVRIFAHNMLAVIVSSQSARHLATLSDLATPGARIVLAGPAVPAGRYAVQFLEKCEESGKFGRNFKQHVLKNVVSYEENVRAVLGKVELGECDAGIVYETDAKSADSASIREIPIPVEFNVTADYPVALIGDAHVHMSALRFAIELRSARGQSILQRHGFMTVPASEPDETAH